MLAHAAIDWRDMNGWLFFAVLLVWLFCGVRVQEMMRRRCHSVNDDGTMVCRDRWQSNADLHGWIAGLGYILGPFMLCAVWVYELADGTTLRRLKQYQQRRKQKKS